MARFWIALGAAHMLLALIIAAATGHRLEGQWAPFVREAFDVAREMQFVHGLALLALGAIVAQMGSRLTFTIAGICFFAGALFFAGGIYAGFGPAGPEVRRIIPVGGALLMLGWLSLLAGAVFGKARAAGRESGST